MWDTVATWLGIQVAECRRDIHQHGRWDSRLVSVDVNYPGGGWRPNPQCWLVVFKLRCHDRQESALNIKVR